MRKGNVFTGVCLSMGGVWQGGMHAWQGCAWWGHGRGHAWQGGMYGGGMHGRGAVNGRGCMVGVACGACVAAVCVAGGHVWWGRSVCMTGETATAADGTHATEMHSCFY